MDAQAMLQAFQDGAGIDAYTLGIIIAAVLGVLFLLWGGFGINSCYGLFIEQRMKSSQLFGSSGRILFLIITVITVISIGI